MVNPVTEKAKELVSQGSIEAAIGYLLQGRSPDDGDVQLEIARFLDSLGQESEAVPCYEKAIQLGVSVENGLKAYLGLGSTYRCLGRYEESLRCLDKGVEVYPDSRALKVFRAVTLYNLGRAAESLEVLLNQLVETSGDSEIQSYRKALAFYSKHLDETW